MKIKEFVFNPFQVNTYLIYDNTGECIIVDPACYTSREETSITDYISGNNLSPKAIINTHGHVDHICGNSYLKSRYDLPIYMHKEDEYLVGSALQYGQIFGFIINPPPSPSAFINEGENFKFGNSILEILHAPGHSPGSILFYSEKDHFLIAGDVIFSGSIGRTDLPKGNFNTLIKSIQTKILILPPGTMILPGHGNSTTVEKEKQYNPFLQ